ncbi:COX15/CtaA family protein [Antribacter soli]|uniref:COX15/CtaA family protein n=1 Tax=Antribacter soli TaxID=2910976 RepID=UPI0027DFA038|nr:COX15/CtaA family protein [Antribacter soli]
MTVPHRVTDPATPPADRPAALWRSTHAVLAWLRRHSVLVLTANLVGQIGIIVTGGAVRLTRSGLGCSTWPQCEPGQFTAAIHPETSYHQYIEFGNRTLTGVLSVVAILVLLVVRTAPGRSRAYRLLGLVPIVGVAAQAVIGGVIVLLHLHPGWVSLHFAVSGALVAASLYLLHRHGEGDGPPVSVVGPRVRALAWALAGLTVMVVVLGVITTGAGPHSGDETVGYRFTVDPALVSKWHAAAVWAFVAVLAAFLFVVHRSPDAGAAAGPAAPARVAVVRRAAWLLLAITLLQGVIGYVQYFTGLPILLVGLHMLGAALLIAGTTRVVLTTRVR